MVIVPTMDVVRRALLIGYITNLGSGLGGVSAGRKLSGNSTLPIATIGVVGTPQMVFTNLTMTIHVNRTIDQPSMSSMVAKKYRKAYAMNLRGGY
jgi:hypothetical protein